MKKVTLKRAYQAEQDAAWLDENPEALAIECPMVEEPEPEKPLNFWRYER